MADQMQVEILEDGTVKVTIPGSIGAANHTTAQRLLDGLNALMGGGEVKVEKLHGHDHHHHGEEGGHIHA